MDGDVLIDQNLSKSPFPHAHTITIIYLSSSFVVVSLPSSLPPFILSFQPDLTHHIYAQLVNAVKSLIIPYIRAADEAAPLRAQGDLVLPGTTAESDSDSDSRPNVLVDAHRPEDLVKRLAFSLPEAEGRGREGLLDAIRDVLRYSVNTWDQGFLDKLYSSTNAVSRRISNSIHLIASHVISWWGYNDEDEDDYDEDEGLVM